MKLGTARTIVWSLLTAVVIFGIIALITQSAIFIVLTVLAGAAEMIVFFGFIKCPHCGRHLDRAGMKEDLKFCPFCGRSLKER